MDFSRYSIVDFDIPEENEFESNGSPNMETSKHRHTKIMIFDEDDNVKVTGAKTSRYDKASSMRKFRFDRAKSKLSKFKKQKIKQALPNLRPGMYYTIFRPILIIAMKTKITQGQNMLNWKEYLNAKVKTQPNSVSKAKRNQKTGQYRHSQSTSGNRQSSGALDPRLYSLTSVHDKYKLVKGNG